MPKYTLEVGGKTYDIESDRSLSDGELSSYASKLGKSKVAGVGAATAIPFIPEQTRQELAETERNIRGGVARGLGSVAATIGLPQAARALGAVNAPNREDMDAYLARTMGVDPGSTAYKGGQIAAEIGAGLPVPRAVGAIAARVPGLAPYAPAISSSGFNPGALTGVQNLLARVGGGAIGGGTAAAIVNPEDTLAGAVLGSVLSPATQLALGAGRTVADRFISPAIGAANALVKAGGEELANALRATRGMKTTPGFKPTLAERAVEGGVETPALAAMERRLQELPVEEQRVFEANKARVVALKNELASIEAEFAKQGAAVTPEATAELNAVRSSLQQRLAAEQTQLNKLAEQLTAGLKKTGPLVPGEELSARAQALKTEARQKVVAPAYDAAFKAAGDTPIDVSGVVASAENILGKPLTAWDPSTAPPIVRALLKLAPKVPEAQPVGAGRISSRMMTTPAAPEGPATSTLENLDAIRKVINQEVTDAARGTSSLSASEARNLMELHSAIDNAIGSSTTLSDDAKRLYSSALETYRTQFAPRFKSGETARLLQPSAFNETRLMPEDAVGKFLADETNARQFVTTFGNDPQARAAMAVGVEDMFRKAVVDPVTQRVKPDAVAKFLQTNERQLDTLEQGGLSIRNRLEQVQQQAANLAKGFDNLAALRTQFGGETAQDVVTNLLKEPSRMRAALQRMDDGAKSALARETSDRVLRQISDGRPQDALKFLSDNKASVMQALGGKGVYQDMVDLTEQAIQLRKVQTELKGVPSFAAVEKTIQDFVPKLSPTEFDSLATVARDIARAQKTSALADIGTKAPAPKPGKAATEAAEETGFKLPTYFDTAATTARSVWAGLEGRVNKRVAAQLTEFMYRDPDAAIDAIEKARQRAIARKAFTDRAGRATTAVGTQAAETTRNMFTFEQESENALAR
jgi:hypothetical protein